MSGMLQGRVAVITGGAGAIGRAIARTYAREGAAVAIVDIAAEAAQQVAADIASEFGVGAIGAAVNVADPAALEALADEVESRLGVVDIVVPNAGILVAKHATEISAEEWDKLQGVNLDGAFHTATVFARRMQAADKPGAIIFTSSLFGVRGGRGNAAYSASKFGVIGLAQSMAAELARHGIRVNSVCPGQIASAMLDQLFTERSAESGRTPEEERAIFEQRIPAGRLGTPDDIAKAFLYLASDLSEYVVGHALLVDGGWQVG